MRLNKVCIVITFSTKFEFKHFFVFNFHDKGAAIYSSDEDESDFEARRNKKDKNKVLRALAESDEESSSGGSNHDAPSGNESNDGGNSSPE